MRNHGAGSLVTGLISGSITCLILGITYLSSPNNFEANKRAYTASIADYQGSNYGRLQQSTAYLDANTTMSPDVTFVNNYGKNAALMPQNVKSLALKASGVNWTLNHTMSIGFPGSFPLVLDAPSPPNQSIGVVRVKCDNGDSGCDKHMMREACQKASCPEAILFTGPDAAGAGEVKNCFFMEWTPYVCLVVDAAEDGSWRLSPTKRYCDWPFTSVRRACGYVNGTTIPYLIRASNDPYVVAQELTQGRMDFGLTESQKILYGGLLVAAGVVLLILAVLLSVFFYLVFWRCASGCSCRAPDSASASAPELEPKFAAANPPVPTGEPVLGEVAVEVGGNNHELQWKDFDPHVANTPVGSESA